MTLPTTRTDLARTERATRGVDYLSLISIEIRGGASPAKRSRIRHVREKARFSVELTSDMRLTGLGETPR